MLDIALLTTQRREDIAALTTNNLRDGYLWIEQAKTGRRIRIKYAGTALEPLLTPYASAFARADRDSGHRIIRKPVGQRLRNVSLKVMSATFAELWSKHVGPRDDSSPTLHEVRALGAKLYEENGIDPQMLVGHLDPKMTRLYLDRHKVQWIDVELTRPGP